ncbi:hypothetical protein AB6N24_15590 [Cellulomonas sp. 179-A 4D5 NHS]|uniref:hypothetical protein n=1 Tax=Cellulomonas sp. 179-A 4D5 NHS TaxID=3142378 RepID=UPI00399FD005
MTDMTPEAAREALVDAARTSDRLRARARWASTKLAVLGLGLGVVTATIGLVESKLVGVAVFAAWGLLVAVTAWWERRRTAHLAGARERTSRHWALSFALYAVAIACGVTRPDGDTAYWLAAGGVVALPMLVGAVRERRA